MTPIPAPAAPVPQAGPSFDFRPLLVAYMTCTMAMMGFVSVIGPIARLLHLAAWQAGAVVTVAPVLILFLALQRYYIRGMLAGSVKG